ncbi:MAG: ATP-binding protein [Sphingobacteriaceae bacterium]|nr:MAG: ATP-binding protein [Sphingobacteriaceae bacterium]
MNIYKEEIIKRGIDFTNNQELLKEELTKIAYSKFSDIESVIGNVMVKHDIYSNIGSGEYDPIVIDESKGFNESGGEFAIVNDCSYALVKPADANILTIGYGVNRRTSVNSLNKSEKKDFVGNLLEENNELINVEDWLMQTDYAAKNGIKEAEGTFEKIKSILTSGILPHVTDIKITSQKNFNTVENYVELFTDYGWIRMSKLGYGYRSSISWILDLAKRMFDFYPNEKDPLSMPAIVIVDEIDLHLHPEWQRKLVKYLSNIYPNVQFIVSAHSPLIIQSADKINLILLRKEGDHVNVSQPNIPTFKGWSIDEILSELMGLDEKTYSDSYIKLMNSFDDALDKDDYEGASQIYNQLDAILHPESNQRKLLRIQMASLSPA